MKYLPGIIATVVVGSLALAGGYWIGLRTHTTGVTPATDHAGSAAPARKLLYYRNPMGLPDTSPTPKKDPMGMDYIAVYEGEDSAANDPQLANTIQISTEKIQKLGVRTETAQLRELDQTVRASARIEADERRQFAIAPKFDGYVDRLHVSATGQEVRKGQLLLDAYSPELLSAQREYLIARQGQAALAGGDAQSLATMQQLAQASLARLKNWDISQAQINTLASTGQSTRTLGIYAPVTGIVTEKKAVQGMRFAAGDTLYQVSDLSAVWVMTDVAEQDISMIRPGVSATIRVAAFPSETFTGKVTYIYPTLNPDTRTAQVRVELPNPGLRLKPAMFAQVEFALGAQQKRLSIPTSAVIDSGVRQVILVPRGQGRFETRAVRLGQQGSNFVEVLEGLKEGEQVVVAANFLIDAESNLKAALGGLSQPTKADPKPAAISHTATGTVDAVDDKAGTVTLSHEPIASLKWPAMTMEFKLAHDGLRTVLKPGTKVSVVIVERAPGEWLITHATPAGSAPAAR